MGRINPAIIIHGGAWDIPVDLHNDHIEGISLALNAGRDVLIKNDDPVRSVIEAVKILENCPVLDAGTGSFLNDAGDVEMDAGVMVGSDLSCGAVGAIRNIKNPIQVADLVRTNTQHCLLAGEGAMAFAKEQGFVFCPTEDLLVGREKERYLKLKQKKKIVIKSFFEKNNHLRDTVGAVAINSKGKIAAGTSTGGTPMKKFGRIGDSPIAGAGYYADDAIGGISATGWGEGILRVLLSKTVLDIMQSGFSKRESARMALSQMKEKVDGQGGVIIIDKRGDTCYYHTAPYMAVGLARADGIQFSKVSKEENMSNPDDC